MSTQITHSHTVKRPTPRPAQHAERRIPHVGTIPSFTTRNGDSRHVAVRDAATAQVAGQPTQDSVRAARVTAVLIKRCRNVLTERCRYITK